jgi:hypothetical protein
MKQIQQVGNEGSCKGVYCNKSMEICIGNHYQKKKEKTVVIEAKSCA